MTAPHPADRIRARVLLFMRLSGFVVLIAGLVLWRTDLFGVRHELAGKIIAVAGLVEILVIPALMLRLWRSVSRRIQ